MSKQGGSRGDQPVRSVRLRSDTPTVRSGVSPSSYTAEQYRNLAVLIENKLPNRKKTGHLLSVTSPGPAAGKTLTSLNLALTLARKGERRVLLVECDLWRPDLSSYFETEDPAPGLTHVLTGRAELNEAVVSVWGAGLNVVTAGTAGTVDNLLADRRMAEVITEMRSLYEIVVLDSAPILLATGKTLASLADRVLVVVRAGRTRKRDVEDALSSLDPKKVMGLVLNRVKAGKLRSPAYSAYAYYGGEDSKDVPSL
ncbi:MAG: CpsD/CapB family tyrosine-protein kinase [Thermoanaerobaculia bacterium]